MIRARRFAGVAVHPYSFLDPELHLPRPADDGIRFVRLVSGDQLGPVARGRIECLQILDHRFQIAAGAV